MNILENLLQDIFEARNILVLTGSGISVECGLPTFRGENGLWDEKIVQEVATLDGFYDDPKRAWKWYNNRIIESSKILPGLGHTALKKISSKKNLTVATQNIDGLHHMAGTEALEIHGNLREILCTNCNYKNTLTNPLEEKYIKHECGGYIRPNIVFFGEALAEKAWYEASKKSFEADLIIAVGTSGIVYPAITLLTPRKPRINVYGIDPNETMLPPWTKIIKTTAAEALTKIASSL